jgi:hypothetical protein
MHNQMDGVSALFYISIVKLKLGSNFFFSFLVSHNRLARDKAA